MRDVLLIDGRRSYRFQWMCYNWLALVGFVYVTVYISDVFTKFILNTMPRRLIDNTNDKAVLITGSL